MLTRYVSSSRSGPSNETAAEAKKAEAKKAMEAKAKAKATKKAEKNQ